MLHRKSISGIVTNESMLKSVMVNHSKRGKGLGKAMLIIEKAQKEDLKTILELQYLAYRSEAELFPNIVIPPLTQTLDEIECEFYKRINPDIRCQDFPDIISERS